MSVNIKTGNKLHPIAGNSCTNSSTIDEELSKESTNPLQNKIITEKIEELNNLIAVAKTVNEESINSIIARIEIIENAIGLNT